MSEREARDRAWEAWCEHTTQYGNGTRAADAIEARFSPAQHPEGDAP